MKLASNFHKKILPLTKTVKLNLEIDLSVYQLKHGDFIEYVDKVISKYNLKPEMIEFEISESQAMVDTVISGKILEKLTAHGIQLSIDDFGTGYSSLSRLHKMPINSVKIDISFIKDIPHDIDSNVISNLIIQLGRQLNIRVIAEGIETNDQLKFLIVNKCSHGQGYFLAKPMLLEDIKNYIENFKFPKLK